MDRDFKKYYIFNPLHRATKVATKLATDVTFVWFPGFNQAGPARNHVQMSFGISGSGEVCLPTCSICCVTSCLNAALVLFSKAWHLSILQSDQKLMRYEHYILSHLSFEDKETSIYIYIYIYNIIYIYIFYIYIYIFGPAERLRVDE